MDTKKDTDFDYVIGAFTDTNIDGYENYHVPASEWAVFTVEGPIFPNLQDTWKRILAEWFPSTDFKHAQLPELEVYLEGDPNSEGYLMEVWIPVTN